jgi:hypothetical protein
VPAPWDRTKVPPILDNTPEFYQRIIGPAPVLPASTQLDLVHGIELETLLACSDGSVTNGTGSHGWVFSNDTNPNLQGAGPDDGHPDYMTSYRSELGGLIAVLYIIHRICAAYNIQSGKVQYYCDNKGVIQNVFHPLCQPSITTFMETDSELVAAARALIDCIPITIIGSWVKGHQSDDKEPKYLLNNMADKLARNFTKKHPPKYRPKRLPAAPPNYKVRLLYDDSVITSKLYPILSSCLHKDSLKAYIIKKAGWTPATFDLINWTAHGRAFSRLSRQQQISTAKLVHNLANTNRQNHLLYNKPSTCPCCNTDEETFEHVLRCHSESANTHRTQAIDELVASLNKLNTPSTVIDAILHGITSWLEFPNGDQRIRAPTVGSLKAADVILTAAFQEQYHTIGWFQLHLGRLSNKWEQALVAYSTRAGTTSMHHQWTTQVILHLWQFIKSMWMLRNTVVHGTDAQHSAELILQELRQQIRALYQEFNHNPRIILPRHSHLFTSRTLDQRLQYSYDHITCWIRSVTEAKLTLQHHDLLLCEQSSRYFHPINQPPPHHAQEDDSSQDSYSPSTDTPSDTSTTLYTTSTDDDTTTDTCTSTTSISSSTSSSHSSCTSGCTPNPPSIIQWIAM